MSSYEDLEREASVHWQDIQKRRAFNWERIKLQLTRPWNCPSCGAGGLLDSICPSCRSARIVELD